MPPAAIALRRQSVVGHRVQQLLAESEAANDNEDRRRQIGFVRRRAERFPQESADVPVGPLRHLQHRLANFGAGPGVMVQVEEHLKAGQIVGPGVVSLAATVGFRLLVRGLRPEWFWIGMALVVSCVTFFGLTLLAGLDNDDKMIVAAIRSRALGALGRTPSF